MDPSSQAHEELYRLISQRESTTDVQIAELMAAHSLLEPAGWMKELMDSMPNGSRPGSHQTTWKEILIASICHVYAALREVEDGEDMPIPYSPVLWLMVKAKALSSTVNACGRVTVWVEGEPLVRIERPVFSQVGVKLRAYKIEP